MYTFVCISVYAMCVQATVKGDSFFNSKRTENFESQQEVARLARAGMEGPPGVEESSITAGFISVRFQKGLLFLGMSNLA